MQTKIELRNGDVVYVSQGEAFTGTATGAAEKDRAEEAKAASALPTQDPDAKLPYSDTAVEGTDADDGTVQAPFQCEEIQGEIDVWCDWLYPRLCFYVNLCAPKNVATGERSSEGTATTTTTTAEKGSAPTSTAPMQPCPGDPVPDTKALGDLIASSHLSVPEIRDLVQHLQPFVEKGLDNDGQRLLEWRFRTRVWESGRLTAVAVTDPSTGEWVEFVVEGNAAGSALASLV